MRILTLRKVDDILTRGEASTLRDYKRMVHHALPSLDRLILFGSRARGDAREDSDYDIAVLIRDLADRPRVRRVLSDLAYEHVLSGFFVRPIPLPSGYLDAQDGQATELAAAILRDGAEVT